MTSREELLQGIHPGMKLDKAFFLRIYGYEISFPGFAETTLKALEDAGCSRAREYYNKVISEYEKKHDEEMKEVAAWYKKECDKEWQKRGEIKRTKKKQTKSENWTELSQILNFR